MSKKKISAAVTDALQNPNKVVVDTKNIEDKLTSSDWEKMQRYYEDLAQMLANLSLSFKELINVGTYNLQQFMTNDEIKEVEVLTKGFAVDLNNLTTDLLKIHKSHEKYKGKPNEDSEEFFFLVSTIESYMSVYDKTMALLPPTIARVTEIVGECQYRQSSSQTVN